MKKLDGVVQYVKALFAFIKGIAIVAGMRKCIIDD